jgi:aryl-alcohol dehydrogenase-like predicted oxidoreductase
VKPASPPATAEACPVVELAPGYEIPRLITGCWQLAADHGAASADFEELATRWSRAVDAGYTTFDCADIYTGVEELLGRFLQRVSNPERVRIHTKYVPDRGDLATLDRRQVERAVDRALVRLGRDRLDMLQFHWWDYAIEGCVEAACWLEEIRRKGKIRLLGLTNFDLEHTERIVEAGVQVSALQVQYSLLDRRPKQGLADWCHRRGVALLAYGCLAGGFLTDAHRLAPDPGTTSLANRSLAKYRLIVDELGGWRVLQELLAALAAVSTRHRVSLATTAIRWVLDRPAVAAAIVGASRKKRAAGSRALWSPQWSGESWDELRQVLRRYPGPGGEVYGLERDPEGPHMAILRMGLNRGT